MRRPFAQIWSNICCILCGVFLKTRLYTLQQTKLICLLYQIITKKTNIYLKKIFPQHFYHVRALHFKISKCVYKTVMHCILISLAIRWEHAMVLWILDYNHNPKFQVVLHGVLPKFVLNREHQCPAGTQGENGNLIRKIALHRIVHM